MSNARGKDGSLKKVNNILIKSMMPLTRVVDKLYLADTTEAEAPSMKAVFDSCMTSLPLLNEANLEVETLCRDAFKPTTPRIYKSLISKPGVSKTLLFGDNMEDQMRSLETKGEATKSVGAGETTKEVLGTFFHYHQAVSAIWQGVSQGSKKWERFPQTNCEHHFGETSVLQEEVVPQKIK